MPNNSDYLLQVVVMKLVSDLVRRENSFGEEPQSGEKLLVNCDPLKSYASGISDLNILDVNRIVQRFEP